MHIAINTIPLSGGHSGRGIGLYTKELIRALGAYASDITVSQFSDISSVDSSVDVIHYPFFDPFFLTMPWRSSKPIVVTIHDLIPIAYPEHFPRGIRGEIKWQVQKQAVRAVANAVITDSRASKEDIKRFFGIPSGRIFPVPLAPRSTLRQVTDKRMLLSLKKRYSIREKFFLYVGDVNWNKNVMGLLAAIDLYKRETKSDFQVILVGRAFLDADLEQTAEIRRFVAEHNLNGEVITPGFISDSDLAAFYSLATACVFPSFAEGFGFPVLEALSCGCPVVTSDVASLNEISGPSIRINPTRPDDILRGLKTAVSLSASKRKELVQKGLDWAKQFTWKKVAVGTANVYEKTLNNHSGL